MTKLFIRTERLVGTQIEDETTKIRWAVASYEAQISWRDAQCVAFSHATLEVLMVRAIFFGLEVVVDHHLIYLPDPVPSEDTPAIAAE